MCTLSELCYLVSEKNDEICELKEEIEKLTRCKPQPSACCCPSFSECTESEATDISCTMSCDMENFKHELKKVKCDIERLKKEKDSLCASQNPDSRKKDRLCEELECRCQELEDLKCELERIRKDADCSKCAKSSREQPRQSVQMNTCQPQCQLQSQPQCPPQSTKQAQQAQCCCNGQKANEKSPEHLQQELTEKSCELKELKCELQSLKKERAMLMEMVTATNIRKDSAGQCAPEGNNPCQSRSAQILCELKRGQSDLAALRCELQDMKNQLNGVNQGDDGDMGTGETTGLGTPKGSKVGVKPSKSNSRPKSPAKKKK